MKLLIISDAWHPQVNGVVRTYEYIVAELEKTGHDVKVIGPADFPVTMPMPGYREIRLALFPARRLKKLIESYRPEQIHIAVEGPLGWAARRYCLKNNKPFTSSYHTQFPAYVAKRLTFFLPFLYKPVHEMAKNLVRHFHNPSRALMVATPSLEQTLKNWGFDMKLARVTRGVSLDQFYPGEKTLFKGMKRPVALYVGRLAIEKNIRDFLDAEWTGSKVVVGDGPDLEPLKRQYPHIHFTGKKTSEALAEHYRSADIFVFPSRTDTFGIVLIEALASGLPIAAYNVTGPVDIITAPYLGALHKDDLAGAMREALNAPGTPEQRANHVKTEYSWEKAARQFADILLKETPA